MALERSAILNREVAALISRYAAVDTMRPDVSELAKSPKYLALFRDVLENHISMIKTRSQTISDGKITVYDKALLVLTTNGKNPLNLGAMELFLDEFLGVRRVAEITGFEKVLQKNIGLRSMLWLGK